MKHEYLHGDDRIFFTKSMITSEINKRMTNFILHY